jgi:hypothetical protein
MEHKEVQTSRKRACALDTQKQTVKKSNAPRIEWTRTQLEAERKQWTQETRTAMAMSVSETRRYATPTRQTRAFGLSDDTLKQAARHVLSLLRRECTKPKHDDTRVQEPYTRDAKGQPLPLVSWCRDCEEKRVLHPKKTLRRTFPCPQDEHEWRWVAQNSPMWDALRAQSAGASSAYTSSGWSMYKSNQDLWHEEMGRLPLCEKSAFCLFACAHGHRIGKTKKNTNMMFFF